MAKRVITNIVFDLKFEVLSTPPRISVQFTDVDDVGRESPKATTHITDAAARGVWDRLAAGEPLLDLLNAEIDKQASAVAEPGSVAARVQAANEAMQTFEKAKAAQKADEGAKKAAENAVVEINKRNARDQLLAETELFAAQGETKRLDEELAAKRAELAALKAATDAEKRAPK